MLRGGWGLRLCELRPVFRWLAVGRNLKHVKSDFREWVHPSLNSKGCKTNQADPKQVCRTEKEKEKSCISTQIHLRKDERRWR